ncbi:uncharacterized protein NDAI_0J01430 [Naumovozyma dairenensis CBS 421]|uniref:Uncharacterized protein n=1 Tax=Naumovozyma dairenensis (strain ATCC 10597 / BCRC 20456 / CBS 421 / NBRC 0211 / NRRL Y-12639) TaxID=1071378 RepID=G0WGV7_NAUDC|nr:hypothetical protein NDAI_0J01430 [Naumovozyma dairenensis CBS 421]CCD27035.1 hypothetical protein NDAI_0J01430 [Naumovozyma dairenensis CBS 421]
MNVKGITVLPLVFSTFPETLENFPSLRPPKPAHINSIHDLFEYINDEISPRIIIPEKPLNNPNLFLLDPNVGGGIRFLFDCMKLAC